MRRSFLVLAIVLAGGGLATAQPNVLLIVSEDNGPELGCYGDAYVRTPVLDALAEGGVRLAEPLMLIVRMPNFWSVGPTSARLDESPSGIGNGARYLGLTGELDWKHTEFFSTGLVVEGAYKYERQGGGPVFSLYSAWTW